MKLSLYTPTHNPQYLKRLGESIRPQLEGLDVEWVIVPNGPARHFGIGPFEGLPIKISVAPKNLSGVGALKAFAVSQCTGDILVEVDHDDELLPECLETICAALNPDKKQFFYSSTLEQFEDGRPNLYGKDFGWTFEQSPYGLYNVGFEPTWRSLCEIFYAPNHVRAWTRKAYDAAGGYDPEFMVCDDHDLLCRTYLAGAEFIFHEKPLYRQSIHKHNTQKEQNKLIQDTQAQVRDKYLHDLAKEWCTRNDLLKIDLGGAFGCPEGFQAIDIGEVPNPFMQMDVTKGIRLPDNSVGFVRACDFLEHIPLGKVVHVMNEIWRVLAPGGLFYSCTPSTDGRGAFQDPTHCSWWNSNSFWYYCQEAQAKYVPEIKAKFQTVGIMNRFLSEFNQLHNIVHVEATLAALKGQRQPGLLGFPDYRS